jgi:predicted DNA-binding transcriptional regulator AlpA
LGYKDTISLSCQYYGMTYSKIPNLENQIFQQRYLSEKQTAEYLGLSVKTIQRHRGTGLGPAYIKAGGRVLYDLHDLDNWMQRHKIQSTSERNNF